MQAKATRLAAWLRDEGLCAAELWAYGDSAGDAALLAMSLHPVWVAGVVIPAVPAEEQ